MVPRTPSAAGAGKTLVERMWDVLSENNSPSISSFINWAPGLSYQKLVTHHASTPHRTRAAAVNGTGALRPRRGVAQ